MCGLASRPVCGAPTSCPILSGFVCLRLLPHTQTPICRRFLPCVPARLRARFMRARRSLVPAPFAASVPAARHWGPRLAAPNIGNMCISRRHVNRVASRSPAGFCGCQLHKFLDERIPRTSCHLVGDRDLVAAKRQGKAPSSICPSAAGPLGLYARKDNGCASRSPPQAPPPPRKINEWLRPMLCRVVERTDFRRVKGRLGERSLTRRALSAAESAKEGVYRRECPRRGSTGQRVRRPGGP